MNGQEPKKKRSKWLYFLLILAVLMVIGAIGNIFDEDETTPESPKNEVQKSKPAVQKPKYTPPIIKVSASKLYEAYEANSIAADDKYKGKTITVHGTIQSIDKDIMDKAYIVIGGSGFLNGVQCMFDKQQEPTLMKLSKGQYVYVRGEVTGKLGNVLMRKCVLE